MGTDARYGPGKYGPMGYGTEAEDHVPEVSELGSETIEKGGGLWKSTERLIRANPDKFKLDPNSKTFVRDARRLTKDLLDKFAEKNGIDYEDLDEIARKKIRPGDILKIVQDPSTGKPSIDYSRDEIFGQGGVPKAGVSSAVEQGTAPKGTDAQEYVPKKPDWMKPYDENIAQAKKNFDYYNLESKAAREALRASQEISYQDSVKLDNIRSLIQNRGFFTHLFSVEHLDWDEPARNYTMGYEGHIPPFPENQTWEDLQKIKFREEMIKTLRKEIGSEENLSLKDWLSRISNQQFKLMETEVRRRINY